MDITALNTAVSSATANPAKSNKIGGDFTTFLKMLTVQLKNQNPLSPMESSEFAVQLATFSGVEQQAHTNDLLASYLDRDGDALAGFADLIGKDVRVSGSAYLGGSAVQLELPGSSIADTATLIVTDENGDIAATHALDPATTRYEWQVSHDAPLARGIYSVSVRYSKDGEELGMGVVSSLSRVAEVARSEGETELVLANGMRVAPENISAVLSPSQ